MADERFCFPVPSGYPDIQAAPLLCAGLIGYRALRLAGGGERLGLYGFGASAHIVSQVAVHQGRRVFAFTREGDEELRHLRSSSVRSGPGAAGEPDADRARRGDHLRPCGRLVPEALRAVGKGGSVVCAGIHMSEIPSFPYEILWGERILRSVANLTRLDGEEFLSSRRWFRFVPKCASYAWSRQMWRWRTCAAVGCEVPLFSKSAVSGREELLLADVTVKRLEDFEAIFHGGFRAGSRRPRDHVVRDRGDPAAARLQGYPEHDQSHDNQEEVYTRSRVPRRSSSAARRSRSSPGYGFGWVRRRSERSSPVSPRPGSSPLVRCPGRSIPRPSSQKRAPPPRSSRPSPLSSPGGTGPFPRGAAALRPPALFQRHQPGEPGHDRSRDPESLERIRSAAAAISSIDAIAVAAGPSPWRSGRPRQSSIGTTPAQPIATSF